jgi:hypothetical protein
MSAIGIVWHLCVRQNFANIGAACDESDHAHWPNANRAQQREDLVDAGRLSGKRGSNQLLTWRWRSAYILFALRQISRY